MNNIQYAQSEIKNKLEDINGCDIEETNEYLDIKFDNKIVDNNTRIYSTSGSVTRPDLIINKFIKCVQDDMNPAFIMTADNNQVSNSVGNIQSILKDPFISYNYINDRIRLYNDSNVLRPGEYAVLEPKEFTYYWSIPRNRTSRRNYIRYKEKSTSDELFKILLKDNENQSYDISKQQFPYTLQYNEQKSTYIVNTPDDNYYYDNLKTLMNEFNYVYEPIHSYLYDVEKYHKAVDNVMFFVVSDNGIYKTKIQTFQKI